MIGVNRKEDDNESDIDGRYQIPGEKGRCL